MIHSRNHKIGWFVFLSFGLGLQLLAIENSPVSLSSQNLNHRPVLLPRRISNSNSNPPVLKQIQTLPGCPGEICGTLAGEAVTPLLAGAGECAQQNMADKIIDVAKTQLKDSQISKKLIQLAIEYRQSERNTFPDYANNPAPDQNSLYCQKIPKNYELINIHQKQSPKADSNLFFDPKAKNGASTTIRKGSDPRTTPFLQTKLKQDGPTDKTPENKTQTKTKQLNPDQNLPKLIPSTATKINKTKTNSNESETSDHRENQTNTNLASENNPASETKEKQLSDQNNCNGKPKRRLKIF
ncbi:hypothetical protein O181_047299 [Austropuccinia psidii MF-1]|uniref:Uncharacterized protein n=1 Tax=Austropuccinia psidii MF-1 TaxID=1389203 RepID=A0A9Q3DQR4_9BASI|nr:hypothetical protein [Austropuccinia psidii MF-1]